MIVKVPLNNVPNQDVTITLDDVLYTITITQGCNNVMYISIKADDDVLISCYPISVNIPVLSRSDKQLTGNFYMFSYNNEYPTFEEFNNNCILVYASN